VASLPIYLFNSVYDFVFQTPLALKEKCDPPKGKVTLTEYLTPSFLSL
jgi:hypothetical protein